MISELHYKIKEYIKSKGGSCEIYPAPFAVFLNEDDKTNHYSFDETIPVCIYKDLGIQVTELVD